MNKKLLTFLCLGLSISLASCGGKSSSSNTDTGTDTGSTNTDTNTGTDTNTTSKEDRSDIEALFAAFEENNGVIDVIDYSVSYCFGNNAFYCDYGDDSGYGYIVNGTQGTYEFYVDGEDFTYGNIIDRSTDGSAITNNVYTLLDLAWLGESVWEQVEPGKYTTTDIDTLDTITFIDGWGDWLGEYITDPLLTIEDNQAVFTGYLDLTEYYGYDDYNEDMVITFKDLGNAHFAPVEEKINNPVEQLGLSLGYDDELNSLISEFTGGSLPNLGFSKESYYEVDEDFGTLDFYDLSSDAYTYSNAVVNILGDAGFNFDFENSIIASGMDEDGNFIPFTSESDDETPYYGYIEGQKTYTNADGDIYAIASVEATYMSPEMACDLNGEEALSAYPDGIVSYSFSLQEFSAYFEVCDELSSLSFPDDFALTSFGFDASKVGLFTVEIMDEYGWLYGCDQYFRIYNTSFANEEEAIAELKLAEVYLNSIGLVTYAGYSADDVADGTAQYVVLDKVFSDGTILELQLSADEEGGVGIALMY